MEKKAKTVSILLSVTMIFVTVFAIISLTYSWYKKEIRADVSSVNLTSASSEGILISGNGSSWGSVLNSDGSGLSIDFDNSISMNSISSSATVVDGEIQFYAGGFVGNTFSTMLLTEQTLYHQFDIYINNTDPSTKKLILENDSSVIDTNNKDVDLSLRIAFINLGSAANIADALLFDGTGVNEVDYIWEPNSTVRNSKIASYHTNYLNEGKMVYEGVNREASNLTLTDNLVTDFLGTPEEEVVDVTTYDPAIGDNNEITLLTPGDITKLRVIIWCEGQDIDCTNSISGGTAEMNINFSSYEVVLDGQDYVPSIKFNTPVITNDTGANCVWSATVTDDIESPTSSTDYLFRISKLVNGELTTIRTVATTATAVNLNNLEALGVGEYYIQVKVYSSEYGSSDFSNSLTFNVLAPPTNTFIATSTFSWDAMTNAVSYTIQALDEVTEISYFVTTTSLSVDLATTSFDGSILLESGKQYKISIKTNGDLGYVNSEYSDTIDWIY